MNALIWLFDLAFCMCRLAWMLFQPMYPGKVLFRPIAEEIVPQPGLLVIPHTGRLGALGIDNAMSSAYLAALKPVQSTRQCAVKLPLVDYVLRGKLWQLRLM